MKQKLFGEIVGTALLLYFGTGLVIFATGYNDVVGPALGWGLTLMVLIYAFGPMSGAHFNPAVTLLMYLTKRMPAAEAGIYVIAQLIGGLIGESLVVFTYKSLLHGTGMSWGQAVAQNHLNSTIFPNISSGMAFLTEVILTTFLMLVILMLNHSKMNTYAIQSPIAVGLTITVLVFVAGNLTGASMNPVRSLFPALFAGGIALQDLWVYLTAPFLAAFIAALIDRYILDEKGPLAA
ncbi:aquaporin Z [Weissella uvarum]|uniref:MIP/aquaporin family protein n=1 Tax=Weissella uvarum TaxID=1479233 RepID=UPI001960FC08|nr:aquaporin [Weissella uvarum]MBM7616574.1 aquaporin Z [Weissella uvarum]MCM0594966.1 aquaporin [Weissella uvarum]